MLETLIGNGRRGQNVWKEHNFLTVPAYHHADSAPKRPEPSTFGLVYALSNIHRGCAKVHPLPSSQS